MAVNAYWDLVFEQDPCNGPRFKFPCIGELCSHDPAASSRAPAAGDRTGRSTNSHGPFPTFFFLCLFVWSWNSCT